MRPDERELDDEIRGHLALSIKERIERGEDPGVGPAGGAPRVRLRAGDPRRDAAGMAQPLVRRADRSAARHAHRPALAVARQRPRRHGRRHPGPRHRRQRRDLQRGARRAAAPAGQSRRGSPGLHPAERAGRRHREHDVLGGRVQRSQGPRHHHRRVRRFLDHRVHDARRRRAPPVARRRRRRVVLRCHGPAAGAGPADERLGRRPRCRRARSS